MGNTLTVTTPHTHGSVTAPHIYGYGDYYVQPDYTNYIPYPQPYITTTPQVIYVHTTCTHCTNTDIVNQLLLKRIEELEKRLTALEVSE